MANIVLFNPPTPEQQHYTREGRCTQEAGIWGTLWPPITLVTSAALLEKDGHRLKVIDFPAINGDLAALKTMLAEFQADYAFWTTGTPTLASDLDLAHLIKQHSPKTVTGVMGTHVTVQPEQALQQPDLDLVIRREPDGVIREICRTTPPGWQTARGISYRDGNHEIIHNPEADFLDPEEIPAPAWHTIARHPYLLPLKGEPFLIVAPIRGCPYPCSFCTASIYYGKKLRKRPVENVVQEIETNITTYQTSNFFILADTFTADKEYVMAFCEEILRRKLKISWTCNSRVDTVDHETMAIMQKAGLWMISFGLESGNDQILQRSGKGISTTQSITAVQAAHGLGLKIAGHFILGLPGETVKTMEQTLDFSKNLPLDIAQFYTAAPFPGTRLHDQARQDGWLKEGNRFSQGQAVMELPGLPMAEVNTFRRKAYKKFYLRAGVILRLFFLIRPKALLQICGNLFRFLRWSLTNR